MAREEVKNNKKVLKEKRISVRIPKDPLNPEIRTCTVYINGFAYIIERGVDVMVPIEVKEILERSGEI